MTRLEAKLHRLVACEHAEIWAATQKCSFQESWDNCHRGDWMLWILRNSEHDYKKNILVSCQIARTVLKHVPDDEKRPLKAIRAAEDWVKGKATLKEVEETSKAAKKLGNSDASLAAAYASTIIHYKPSSFSYLALAVVNTAHRAAHDANGSGKKFLLKSAKIVRKYFPKYPRVPEF